MNIHYVNETANAELSVQEGAVVMYFAPEEAELVEQIVNGLMKIAEEEYKPFLRDVLLRVQKPEGMMQ